MLGIDYGICSKVILIIVLLIMLVNTLYSFVLHNKRKNYFKSNALICGYIGDLLFLSCFIMGGSFLAFYSIIYQVHYNYIEKSYLLHLIYLIPLFCIGIYFLLKCCLFRMELSNGFLIIRNAIGVKSKHSIYQLKYKRRLGLFTILYKNKKRKILVQSKYILYNLENILDRISIQK